jgi:uncharacterized membrane protein
MEKRGFSIGDSLKFGWDNAGKNWIIFLVYFVFAIALSAFQNSLTSIVDKVGFSKTMVLIPENIISIAGLVASIILGMGLVKVMLKIVDGVKPQAEDLYSTYKNFFSYLGVSILYGLIVLAGFILLLVPGICWGIKYRFAPTLVIDKGMGPMEALRESAKMTEGQKWDLFALGFVQFAVIIIGLIALVIGIFPAIIIIGLSSTYIYRRLSIK